MDCDQDVILVSERMYAQSGGIKLYKWTELARGTDADYEVLEEMAKLTDNFVELRVNREMRNKMRYEKRGEEYNKC
jgi:hypothetical protein